MVLKRLFRLWINPLVKCYIQRQEFEGGSVGEIYQNVDFLDFLGTCCLVGWFSVAPLGYNVSNQTGLEWWLVWQLLMLDFWYLCALSLLTTLVASDLSAHESAFFHGCLPELTEMLSFMRQTAISYYSLHIMKRWQVSLNTSLQLTRSETIYLIL